jgi:hypothetical protein
VDSKLNIRGTAHARLELEIANLDLHLLDSSAVDLQGEGTAKQAEKCHSMAKLNTHSCTWWCGILYLCHVALLTYGACQPSHKERPPHEAEAQWAKASKMAVQSCAEGHCAHLAEKSHDARLLAGTRRAIKHQVTHVAHRLWARDPLQLGRQIIVKVQLIQLRRPVLVNPQHLVGRQHHRDAGSGGERQGKPRQTWTSVKASPNPSTDFPVVEATFGLPWLLRVARMADAEMVDRLPFK